MLASAPPIWIQAQRSQVRSLSLSITVTFPKDWSKVTCMMRHGEDSIAPGGPDFTTWECQCDLPRSGEAWHPLLLQESGVRRQEPKVCVLSNSTVVSCRKAVSMEFLSSANGCCPNTKVSLLKLSPTTQSLIHPSPFLVWPAERRKQKP